jgi:hypothetical protein
MFGAARKTNPFEPIQTEQRASEFLRWREYRFGRAQKASE